MPNKYFLKCEREKQVKKKNTKKMHFLPNNTQQKKINKISRIIYG